MMDEFTIEQGLSPNGEVVYRVVQWDGEREIEVFGYWYTSKGAERFIDGMANSMVAA